MLFFSNNNKHTKKYINLTTNNNKNFYQPVNNVFTYWKKIIGLKKDIQHLSWIHYFSMQLQICNAKKRDREEQSAEIFNILPSTILKNIYEQNNN